MATEASSQAGARKRQKSRKSRDRSELRPRTDQQARRGEKRGLEASRTGQALSPKRKFPDASSNDASDEARNSPDVGGSSTDDGSGKAQVRFTGAPESAFAARSTKDASRGESPGAGTSTSVLAKRSRNELALDSADDRKTTTALLRRSGPILSEYPELARYFSQRARNARGACVHECTMCSYTTLNKTTLLYHVVGKHFDIKPFLCTQGCGAERGSYSNMRQHELRAHQIPYYNPGKLRQTPNYFVCSGCRQQFHAPLDLLRHYLGHHMPEQPQPSSAAQADRASDGASDRREAEIDELQRRSRVRCLMSIEHLTEPSNDESF